MSKIKVSDLINDFQLMTSENWPYAVGTDKSGIDCSGAFVWAYKQHGKSIYHGSNRIARTEVADLIPIGIAKIIPGMAAFKRRQAGENGYALPSGYKVGGKYYNGDLDDYYHIGLIDYDTSRVLNARNTQDGFVSSPITQGWTHVAYLSQVDYDTQEEVDQMLAPKVAVVRASSGSTVKMRGKPDTSYGLYWDVPVGSTVQILDIDTPEGWAYVQYGSQKGYMMENFLQYVDDEYGGADEVTNENVTLILDASSASALMNALRMAGVS